jgi:wyosine [tRNA(Phe)-imidazoG37] synthetase (radical SAM superfamily)
VLVILKVGLKNEMLTMEKIREWVKELQKLLPNFEFMDDEDSRIVILRNKDRYVDRWIVK